MFGNARHLYESGSIPAGPLVNILDRIAQARAGSAGGSGYIPSHPPNMPEAVALHRALAAAHEAPPPPPVPEAMRMNAVPDTNELRRILHLTRRNRNGEELARELTEAYRTPWGSMTLRPIQGLALAELYEHGGLFGPIRVGGGKTLISYLAPSFSESERPLLVIPANLRAKTQDEFRTLAYNWQGIVPSQFRIESYEALGRVTRATLLEQYQPDLIVMDEAHRAKNPRAAVTRRLERYIRARRGMGLPMKVAAFSGTITNRSLRDYAHIVEWCFPSSSPVPLSALDLEAWADALDERVNPFSRVQTGALIYFCNEEQRSRVLYGGDVALQATREAYRDRLVSTPGVVATQDGELGVSLSIESIEAREKNPAIEEAFKKLRTEWETPDGWPISDPMTLWRHARELAMGFFYRWNPRPPDEWLTARRDWARCVREILSNNRRNLDSELQVTNAVAAGLYKGERFTRAMTKEEKEAQGFRAEDPDLTVYCSATELLERWRAIKPIFIPNTEPVWISSEALDTAAEWATKHAGLIWIEHNAFGHELARRSGLPFYAQEGRTAAGQRIEHGDPKKSLIASVASNGTGRNLQAWSEALIMSCNPNGKTYEQMLGRNHRDGQEADTVEVWHYLGALEQVAGFWQAVKDSTFTEHTTGQAQKLVYCDKIIPSLDEISARGGFRWTK